MYLDIKCHIAKTNKNLKINNTWKFELLNIMGKNIDLFKNRSQNILAISALGISYKSIF